MDLTDLDKIAQAVKSLPHLLVKIPDGELTPAVSNGVANDLQAQLNDNHIAERLGRAFMLGRLHRFMNVKLAATPPLDTLDECNLYSGGYQYDTQRGPNPILDQLIAAERAEEKDRTALFEECAHTLSLMVERYKQSGPTLELVEEMVSVRMTMQSLIVANLISRIKVLEARMVHDFGDIASLYDRSDELAGMVEHLLDRE